MGSIAERFDYMSLKELLKGTKAEVLTPGDGQKYEDIIQRWSESCVKRAVSPQLSLIALESLNEHPPSRIESLSLENTQH